MSTAEDSQKKLWLVAAGVWLIGLLILVGGGYLWWSRQTEPETVVVVATSSYKEVDSPTAEAVTTENEAVTATSIPTAEPTATPLPPLPIAYLDGDELWLMDETGEIQQQVMLNGEVDSNLSWSSDGRYLMTGDTLINIETGETQALAIGGPGHSFIQPFAWSPDASKLAYLGKYEADGYDGDFIPIQLLNIETGDIETLEIGYTRQNKNSQYVSQQMVWLDDEQLLVNVVEYIPASEGLGQQQLFRLNLAQSKTFKPLLTDFTNIQALTLAPDGETIFFVGRKSSTANHAVYQTDGKFDTPTRVNNLTFCNPCYLMILTDQTILVQEEDWHISSETLNHTKLSVVQWPDSEVVVLSDLLARDGYLNHVSVAPNSRVIAFQLYRADTDETQLFFLSHLGATPQPILSHQGKTDWDYQWANDGQTLWVTDVDDPTIVQQYDLTGDLVVQFGIGAFAFNPAIEIHTGQQNDGGDTLALKNDTSTTASKDSNTLVLVAILPPTATPSPSPTPRPSSTPSPTPTKVYVAPTATPIPPCPNPGVQINSPIEGSTFYDRHIYIVGNANIASFHHYRLEYSTSRDGHTWNFLFENDYPVDNGKLMMLDSSTVPNGPYGIRLTVVDQSGNYPEPCEVWFWNGFW